MTAFEEHAGSKARKPWNTIKLEATSRPIIEYRQDAPTKKKSSRSVAPSPTKPEPETETPTPSKSKRNRKVFPILNSILIQTASHNGRLI